MRVASVTAWSLLVLASCGKGSEPTNTGAQAPRLAPGSAPETATGTLTALGEKGLFRFRIRTDPAPPALGDYFSVWTTVERVSETSRVRGGTLVLDATMPEHRHGMTTLPKTRLYEDGRFHTVGCRFHMHGRWVIELTFSHDGKRDHATIEFPFHPPISR